MIRLCSLRCLPSTLIETAFALLLTSTLAQATDLTTTCEAAKVKAAGKKADCIAGEETKAWLGKPSNPTKCEKTFSRAFTKAETAAMKAGGVCPVTGDAAVIEYLVDACVENTAATILGTPPPPCTASHFPASGQMTAYQANKNDGIPGAVAIPDDGSVEAGATLSYTDNGDGTVTDNNTGLMWEKKTNLDSTPNFTNLHDADNEYVWSGNGAQETIWDWLEDINAEGGTGYAGHNDWRIPTIKELQSIVDYERVNPAINPIFGPTVASFYWSSTSNSLVPSFVWSEYFYEGDIFTIDGHGAAFSSVRAVRGLATDPTTICGAAKLKAAGKKAACVAAEEAKAALNNPANPAKCENAFARAFTKAEESAAAAGEVCPVTGDVAVIENLVDTCIEDIAATISGTPPSPCVRFPASGQTVAYQANKNDGIARFVAIPDDGTVKAGATLSYTDNGDGTITDNNTGLMWEKKTNLDSTTNFVNLHDADNYYVWSGNGAQETIWDWLEDVNAEGGTGYAGYNDWRIPTIKELHSIVNYGIPYPGPVTNPVLGPTKGEDYWSSTSYTDNPSRAWYVRFDIGYFSANALDKSNLFFIRAVRGGL